MHISEGVLSAPVLLSGAGLTALGIAVGLKKMKEEDIPETAIVSAALFVTSLIHLPLGPTSVHLILNGIAGILLGWQIFPAFIIALFLQSVLFQFGGITALGVNTLNVALPGMLVYYFFKIYKINKDNKIYLGTLSFICGALAVFLTALMVAVSLMFTDQSFLEIAKLAVLAHLPVMLIEGIIAFFVITFIKKVKPELLRGIGQDEIDSK
ncbi:cobalt transporter CbiM [Halocella sp. SP3-1]|uniref:cobalt transporter CbiM n=1 Tax=Halocella sp. SP3-1 TaxID=2382161 RepID=UPI000F7611C2|nr:cobalt transporter CbiM [Halocella sp. SP3-1]AZO95926.1 cobalt transporter CbiM [Halocella sp. SP3-1]